MGVIEQVTAVLSPVVSVGHSVEMSQASPPKELVIHQLPPVIGSHSLQGTGISACLVFQLSARVKAVRQRAVGACIGSQWVS